MLGQGDLYLKLRELNISFEYYEHPLVSTISDAIIYWANIDSGKCKNIFVRNHKGDRHYLIILEHLRQLNMRDLEKRLKQGKLTFASDQRLKKYLGVDPGSVSPFGLLNDREKHVYVFIDEALRNSERLIFHPNVNTSSLVIRGTDFIRFLESAGNAFEFIRLYND
jgi:Ala-tRNA(Pro) deacylase